MKEAHKKKKENNHCIGIVKQSGDQVANGRIVLANLNPQAW